jgi:hypothetical protein
MNSNNSNKISAFLSKVQIFGDTPEPETTSLSGIGNIPQDIDMKHEPSSSIGFRSSSFKSSKDYNFHMLNKSR